MGIFSFIQNALGYNPEQDGLNDARNIAGQGYDTAIGQYAPYQQAGQNALTKYLNATGQGDSSAGMADFQNSPIFKLLQSSLNFGNAGVLANSAGSLNSGNTLRALQDYAQQGTNQAFGSYLNPLASVANQGYDASGRVAGLDVEKAGTDANFRNQQGQLAGAQSLGAGLDTFASQLAQGAGFLTGMGGFGGGGASTYGGGSLLGGGTGNALTRLGQTFGERTGMAGSLY